MSLIVPFPLLIYDGALYFSIAGPNDAMSTQITVHKRQALALKREGRLAEAKDELRKAKMLEKQAEEMALLGEAGGEDEASDDDEIHALIRRLEREEKLKGNAGKGGASQSIPEDFGLGFSFVDDDDDAHVEVWYPFLNTMGSSWKACQGNVYSFSYNAR